MNSYSVTTMPRLLHSIVFPTALVAVALLASASAIAQTEVNPSNSSSEEATKPFATHLITQWGEELTAENAWQEYPRPQLCRENWTNLNGEWDYTVTPATASETPTKWDGLLLVPFCLESKLGGVERLLGDDEALWYRRTFQAKPEPGIRLLLNFEAVDYRCEVFVNGQSLGRHQGGNTPFSFDMSELVVEGDNDLVVRVEDDTEEFQLRGKQTRNPRGIWYTRVSGIWQTVWMEKVPSNYIVDLKLATDASTGTIRVTPHTRSDAKVRLSVKKDGKVVVQGTSAGEEISLQVPDAQLWSPSSPTLYDIEAELLDSNGEVVDKVQSYAGIRSVGRAQDANGYWKFTLNGQEIFHWGPLDQGWWPDGLLTPPSDEAMLSDIAWLKQAGFNMIRKHIKVEPRRYYYHCDRLGMMVWQDHVSGGPKPEWTRLRRGPNDAQWPEQHHQQFMAELEAMIFSLENHPSIVVWVPFNEAWGQHKTVEVGEWVEQRDPTRLVNIASGGNFWPVGHIVDAHAYPSPAFPFKQGGNNRFQNFIKVVGEFGGHGYPVPEHLWDASRRNWGYGGLPQSKEEYKQRYVDSIQKLIQLQKEGIAAGVYTQTTDVEGEINGLLTYDRKVRKIPADELARLHQPLLERVDAPPKSIPVLSPPNFR